MYMGWLHSFNINTVKMVPCYWKAASERRDIHGFTEHEHPTYNQLCCFAELELFCKIEESGITNHASHGDSWDGTKRIEIMMDWAKRHRQFLPPLFFMFFVAN